jgi:CBS-domain-containing membrane protein
MTRDLITCREDDDLQAALAAMGDYQVRRIPIVDEQNRLVGIIAQADVATRAGHEKETGEIVEQISKSRAKSSAG